MISNVVSGYLSYISSIFEGYGITSLFKYQEDNDVTDEYRRMYHKVVTKNSDPDNWDDPDKMSNSSYLLGVYSRTPLRKNPSRGRNSNVEAVSESGEGTLQINSVVQVEFDISITIISPNTSLMDMVEILLCSELCDKAFSIGIDYKLGPDTDQLEGMQYSCKPDAISEIAPIQNSNMRSVTINTTISGGVFVPYYKSMDVVEVRPLNIYVFNKSVDPVVKNIDNGYLTSVMYPPEDSKIND